MPLWERTPAQTVCGGCSGVIPMDAPRFVLVPRKGWTTRRFYRCAACAGEPAPMNLPARVEMEPTARFTFTHQVARDGKAAAIAREPGEDD